MNKGDGEKERQKNKIMRKTILNICEATSHYSPLISSPAHAFIYPNYFTNFSTSFTAFMGKRSSTYWFLF